ncbi:MAG: helix-turn-helix domain-containing protein [Alphaproteobacteria bacterium]|nr:helix-turn-helix domain-containing protein [Alphaproteobacteria bacterium]
MADNSENARALAAPVDIAVFDTRIAAPDEQFGLWRDSIGVLFDIDAGPDAGRTGYRARLDSAMAGEAMVTRVQAGAQAFSRSTLRSYRDGIEGVMFQVFTRGNVCRRGDTIPIAAENALIGFDLTRDMQTVNSEFDLVSIIFPRDAIESRLGKVSDLHLQAIGSDSGLAQLTAGFLVSLQRTLGRMDTGEAAAAVDAAADLIAECYRGQTRRLDGTESHRIATVTRAKSFIRSRIHAGEPVDVAIVSRALDVSRATLYRAFEPIGGVAAYIRAERLRACLMDIARLARGEIAVTLGELAMRRGFESDAQFSRAFKAEFGMTPSEAKRALAKTPGFAGEIGEADRRYELWVRAVGAA